MTLVDALLAFGLLVVGLLLAHFLRRYQVERSIHSPSPACPECKEAAPLHQPGCGSVPAAPRPTIHTGAALLPLLALTLALAACGASYWLKAVSESDGIASAASDLQKASEDDLGKLAALLCQGHALRTSGLAKQVLELRAAEAKGEAVADKLAAAQKSASDAQDLRDSYCKLAKVKPAKVAAAPVLPAAASPDAGAAAHPDAPIAPSVSTPAAAHPDGGH